MATLSALDKAAQAQRKKSQAKATQQAQDDRLCSDVLRKWLTDGDITYAPEADMFPTYQGEEFNDLVDSMRSEGRILSPILIDRKGRIVDGRHRMQALKELGCKHIFIDDGALVAATDLSQSKQYEVPMKVVDDVPSSVIAANLARRNLTPAQRASLMVKLKRKPTAKERATKASRSRSGGTVPPSGGTMESDAELAKKAGVGTRTMERARRDHELDPKITEAVIAGDSKKAKELRDKATGSKPKQFDLFDAIAAHIKAQKTYAAFNESYRETVTRRGTPPGYQVQYSYATLSGGRTYFYFKPFGYEHITVDVNGNELDDDKVIFDGIIDSDDVNQGLREAIDKHIPTGFCAYFGQDKKDDVLRIYRHRHGEPIQANVWPEQYPEWAYETLYDSNNRIAKILAIKSGSIYVQDNKKPNAVRKDGTIHLLRVIKVNIKTLKAKGEHNGIFTIDEHERREKARQQTRDEFDRILRGIGKGSYCPPDIDDQIKRARSTVQKEHPDRGGDNEKFLVASKELERLKELKKLPQRKAA